MQSICGSARYMGNARYMWKCKVYKEMQGICGNARYMWKCKSWWKFQSRKCKLQGKQSNSGKNRSQWKCLSLMWKKRRQDRNVILSGNVSLSRSLRQSGNASHIGWEQKMSTNGGKLGKGGLRWKCRWGKEERKSGKWHEIDIQVHKQ